MCTLLVTHLSCFSWWVGLVLNVHSFVDTPVLFQDVSWPGFQCALFWWHTCLVWGCELALFIMCTLLVTHLSYFSWWVGLVFNVHSSGDTPALFQLVSWPCFQCALFWWHTCLVSGCELALFLICTLLVTHLSYFSWSVGLVFNVYSFGDTPALFQKVSWPCFQCALFWWHTCLVSEGELAWFLMCTLLVTYLSSFRQWVGLVFNVHSSGDTFVLFQLVSWSCF